MSKDEYVKGHSDPPTLLSHDKLLALLKQEMLITMCVPPGRGKVQTLSLVPDEEQRLVRFLHILVIPRALLCSFAPLT